MTAAASPRGPVGQAPAVVLTSPVAVGFLANAAIRDARALIVKGQPGKAEYILTRAGQRIARLTGERFECSPAYLASLEAAGLGRP